MPGMEKMSDIKFRAWVNNSGMFYGVGVDRDGNPMFYDPHNGPLDGSHEYPCYENFFGKATTMQYTGLKDKNGKEIYEGDIVVLDGEIIGPNDETLGVIKFNAGEGFMVYPSGDDTGLSWSLMTQVYHDGRDINVGWEVIGNVHKNPELLNEKESK
jgi:uncharacterized phage protein (TIGR01671 family)